MAMTTLIFISFALAAAAAATFFAASSPMFGP